MINRFSIILIAGLACSANAAYGQSAEQQKTAADVSWMQGIQTNFTSIRTNAAAVPVVAQPLADSGMLAWMQLLASTDQHNDPESEHHSGGLSKEGREQIAKWIKELEKSDDWTWSRKVSVAPSPEDMITIQSVKILEPWINTNNVFFMGEAAWDSVSVYRPAFGETFVNATGPRGLLPIVIIKADLGPSEKKFTLLHEGFHMKEAPAGEVQVALYAALEKTDVRQNQRTGNEVTDFIVFLGEGRAQKNAIALAKQTQLDVAPRVFKAYADNVTIVTALVNRIGDEALDALLDKADASLFVTSLGDPKTRLLMHSVYLWQNAPRADKIPLDEIVRTINN